MEKRAEIKTRNVKLDIIKGIAIIVVVAIHAQMPVMKWLQLIQMQTFFIVAGFWYNIKITESADGMFIYIKKRIKSLYVPCLLWSTAVTLSHNILVEHFIIADEFYTVRQLLVQLGKCVLFSGGANLWDNLVPSDDVWGVNFLYVC